MILANVADAASWDSQAAAYRTIAEATSDELERLGYLQRAAYCEAMAVRRNRFAGEEARVLAH